MIKVSFLNPHVFSIPLSFAYPFLWAKSHILPVRSRSPISNRGLCASLSWTPTPAGLWLQRCCWKDLRTSPKETVFFGQMMDIYIYICLIYYISYIYIYIYLIYIYLIYISYIYILYIYISYIYLIYIYLIYIYIYLIYIYIYIYISYIYLMYIYIYTEI